MALERMGVIRLGSSETIFTAFNCSDGAGTIDSEVDGRKNWLATFSAFPPSLVFAASLDGLEIVEGEGVEGIPSLANCYLRLAENLEGDLDDCL